MSHDQEHRADIEANREGYIKGNDYALAHLSKWSERHADDLTMLGHMNCCFLSTRGVPPTLLALKQHVQSLCYLISALEPSERSVEVHADHHLTEADVAVRDANAFDWLADMRRPYTNDNPDHHRALFDLLNQVKSCNDIFGTAYHCPLEQHKPRRTGTTSKPYASHGNLLMHANDCLERLDHEYSTTGGLLSILPTEQEHDQDDLRMARNTLLGQWLMFTQQLVGRMHELEIAYGNATDALAGEAVVPMQHASAMGPDARSGRAIVYPQDRWVLANAGDDVFDHLHRLLDREEALMQEQEMAWNADAGAIGERLWVPAGEELDERGHARGIVRISVATRFYRLKGQGRNTIFVVPGWDHHPATQATKALETRPTVVSVRAPRSAARVSELEARYDDRIAKADLLLAENRRLQADNAQKDAEVQDMAGGLEYERRRAGFFEARCGQDNPTLLEERQALQEDRARLLRRCAEAEAVAATTRQEAAAEKARADGLFAALAQVQAEREELRARLSAAPAAAPAA